MFKNRQNGLPLYTGHELSRPVPEHLFAKPNSVQAINVLKRYSLYFFIGEI